MADKVADQSRGRYLKFLEIFRNIKAKNKTALGVVSILSLTTIGGVATHASYTDAGASNISAAAGSISPGAMELESWPYLFSVNKAVTGNTYTKTVTVKNNGSIPMKYTAVLEFYRGDASVLSAIPTTAVIDATTVYTGSLNNLKIPTQTVAVGSSQTITLIFKPVITDTVREVQGLNAQFDLKFTYTN